MAKQKKRSDIIKNRARKAPVGFFRRLTKLILWFLLVCLVAGAITAVVVYFHLSEDLPKISSLSDYRPSVITTAYSDDGRKIAEFYRERRIVVPLDQMSPMLKEAFIAAEDARFYKHKGIDIFSIVRAFFKNIEAGTIVQGGSTITQQVTKSFLLTPERSYQRKIKEALLAYRIDKALTKDEILYLYLNQIYLGHGAYGVEASAENCFDKSAKELNLAECAMLAGLPQAPSRYSPFRHPERAKQRQIYVLNRMVAEGFITNIQATEAINTTLDIKPRRNWYIEKVPYYTEYVRKYVEKKYGADMLYQEGLQIHTAVNIESQKIARAEIEKGLRALDKRQGYRGPEKHLEPTDIESFISSLKADSEQVELAPGRIIKGVVAAVDDADKSVMVRLAAGYGKIALSSMRWARNPDPEVAYYEAPVIRPSSVLREGDVVQVSILNAEPQDDIRQLALEQTPEAQAALYSIEAETGLVKAMIGGRDFRHNQFNRAIQSRRQPGSAFKPIIYTAALDKGYTPATVIIDSPIVFEDAETHFKWKPKNYEKKFHGPTLLRDALSKSRNIISIKILKDIGIDYAIEYARKLGITANLSRDLSIALGSSGVSLAELVTAFSVFANQGYMVTPIYITKIVDRDGKELEINAPDRRRVIEKTTAYIMTNLLESVVKHGTARRVRALNRPTAGKTGTTNNLFDAWFVGYTPRIITGAWTGFDSERSLGKGETGSRAASPIWLGFMKKMLAEKPVRVFEVPEGVVFSKIDTETGLLPIASSKKTRFEVFKEGSVPTKYSKPPDVVIDSDKFFKSDF
ncbi:MAG: PBP1A family penicillin-binding protein [Deltaproteobacteria bacterium]|nr:PBP1A family penicillin-binding protein [Deltaproteobacteria bacterium]